MPYRVKSTTQSITGPTYRFNNVKYPVGNFLYYSTQELTAIDVELYTPPPPPDPEPQIPQTVTPAQARAELFERGLLVQAEQIVAEHPYPLVQIYWNHASQIERNNAYINGIAYELGLEDLDDVFTKAAAREF